MIYKGRHEEFLELRTLQQANEVIFDDSLHFPLVLFWVRDEHTVIEFENMQLPLEKNTILCLSIFREIKFTQIKHVSFIKFNREFYCVLDHDEQVGCKGILFYGTNKLPYFIIPPAEIERFTTLWRMFELEMRSKDELQLEMLQTMLKRFIILCTRIYKMQHNYFRLEHTEIDLIREYDFLVEKHFKEKHTVKEYAEMLNKSAKTLSNVFSKFSDRTPLQFIRDRRLLEAKKLLRTDDMSVKEVAYALEFPDIQSFSRFFKKNQQVSPSEYKNRGAEKLTT